MMFQMFATTISLLLAAAAVAVIAQALAGDWKLMKAALRGPRPALAPLPPRTRPLAFAREVRVLRVTPQSAPRAAAA